MSQYLSPQQKASATQWSPGMFTCTAGLAGIHCQAHPTAEHAQAFTMAKKALLFCRHVALKGPADRSALWLRHAQHPRITKILTGTPTPDSDKVLP